MLRLRRLAWHGAVHASRLVCERTPQVDSRRPAYGVAFSYGCQPPTRGRAACGYRPAAGIKRGSSQVEAVQVHDLAPRGHKVADERLLAIVAGVHLSDGPEFGV